MEGDSIHVATLLSELEIGMSFDNPIYVLIADNMEELLGQYGLDESFFQNSSIERGEGSFPSEEDDSFDITKELEMIEFDSQTTGENIQTNNKIEESSDTETETYEPLPYVDESPKLSGISLKQTEENSKISVSQKQTETTERKKSKDINETKEMENSTIEHPTQDDTLKHTAESTKTEGSEPKPAESQSENLNDISEKTETPNEVPKTGSGESLRQIEFTDKLAEISKDIQTDLNEAVERENQSVSSETTQSTNNPSPKKKERKKISEIFALKFPDAQKLKVQQKRNAETTVL
eukprot:TRINITY_DN8473_c0_g1_i1.p1 TRINITY_DN8473_c0_g1~~TRINITY_DN8473_c0_g1_i1.p1  ORF type:complete len:294 (+),score=89.82 TRINITY_DN8473_c0_g1_i1:209-1090(+)